MRFAWEYRVHRFAKKGWVAKNETEAERLLNNIGEQGWELVSLSDSEAIAVFKRRFLEEGTKRYEVTLSSTLADELVELGAAIEELER